MIALVAPKLYEEKRDGNKFETRKPQEILLALRKDQNNRMRM